MKAMPSNRFYDQIANMMWINCAIGWISPVWIMNGDNEDKKWLLLYHIAGFSCTESLVSNLPIKLQVNLFINRSEICEF